MKISTPYFRALAVMLFALVFSISVVRAQTSAFTYQGQLNDGASAANGTYQMQFSLFDAATNGTQSGATITNTTVTVLNGIFTVQLDFTAAPLATGATRFLQIAVKKPSDATYTTLTPRQPITSSPSSIRTINAGTSDALSTACAACVTDAQIAGISGSKVTGTVANAANATNAQTANNASSATTATNATNAVNVTGTVAVANGGTGATSATAARTNLGLGSLATVTPSGTASATTFLRGDNTYAAIPSSGSSIGTTLLGRSTSNSNATAPAYLNIVGLGALFLSTQANLPTTAEVVMPIAGTADTLYIKTGGTAPTFAVTYTLYKNNAATALACTIQANGTNCTATGSIAIAAGDNLLLRVDGFAGTLPSSTTFLILSGLHIK